MNSIRQKTADWLRQGISPRRLALTLALGLAVGCIPVVGLPTALCLVLAFVLRLNVPVIQAANYAAMPLQLVLIAPFVRMGGWMVSQAPHHGFSLRALLHISPMPVVSQIVAFAGQALLAWLVLAIPAVVLLTAALTVVLRQVPALAAANRPAN